ncbi:hypothetical protein [Tsukamurella soli]|uniref:hypothetical protein n=1 Tax=Tsukamurella soli TaxID=644556 RepID=UPI00361E88DC
MGAVVLIAAIVTVFTACRYHLFGDELYFVAAGRHPAWSYADQGPMIPCSRDWATSCRGTRCWGSGSSA